MPPDAAPLFLSTDHFVVVGATLVLNVWLCRGARGDPGAAWIPWFRRALALLLVANAVVTHVSLLRDGQWDEALHLNLHLCDAATAACVVALLYPGVAAFELAYFWGLVATLQGVVTPAIDERFPHPVFLQFFVLHAGVVTAAVFLAFGMRMTPRPWVVPRMMLWTNAMAAVAAVGCLLTGGNYMFLREPPSQQSLLDLLGPWPWYLLAAEVVAAIVFSLLAVPFWFRKRAERQGAGLRPASDRTPASS
jgi:hypothetical integral membrane protein (TIGR02206 family)